jgi:DNA-binding Xre family transcriptional regulator
MKKKINLDLRTESLISEIAEALTAVPRSEGGRIYSIPSDIRSKIVRITMRKRLRPAELARRLGISATSIRGWTKNSGTKKGKRVKASKLARFRSISVTSDLPTKGAMSGGSVVLELPGGAKVHGLRLEHLRELMGVG